MANSVTVRLLTRDSTFRAALPAGVVPRVAMMTGSLVFGGAPRQVWYTPHASGAGLKAPASHRARAFTSPDGFDGMIYEAPQSPSMLVAQWRLPAGILSTFMPTEDAHFAGEPAPGLDGLRELIAGVRIQFAQDYPRLTTVPGIGTGDISDMQGRAESFFSPAAEGGWPAVKFTEHNRLGDPRRAVAAPVTPTDPEEWTHFESFTEHGLCATVMGPSAQLDELQEMAVSVGSSVERL